MFDYVALSGSLAGRRIEYVDHLHEHLATPELQRGPLPRAAGRGRWWTASRPTPPSKGCSVTNSIAACLPARSGFLPIFDEVTDAKRLSGGGP